MPVNPKIYITEPEVRDRLKELGLTLEQLKDIMRHYGLSINSFTANHPSWGQGITSISEAIFATRTRLGESGWTREEESGFALTVHPDKPIAINVAKGNENTGQPEFNVETSARKGICTEYAVSANQLVLDLPPPKQKQTNSRQVWYILLRKVGNVVAGELSLPVGISEDGHISLWRERIIMPSVNLDGDFDSTAGFETNEYDVSISRKK